MRIKQEREQDVFSTGHQDLEVVKGQIREGHVLSMELIRFIPHYLRCETCRRELNQVIEERRSASPEK